MTFGRLTLALLFLGVGPHGILARTWTVSSMVVWVVMMLAIYLVVNFYTG